MDLENLNFKTKDIISFLVYIIPATFFVATIIGKIDKANDAIEEFKNDKKEFSVENKANIIMNQNDIKALQLRAELSRQSIEILQKDMEILKRQYNYGTR